MHYWFWSSFAIIVNVLGIMMHMSNIILYNLSKYYPKLKPIAKVIYNRVHPFLSIKYLNQ